MGPLDFGQPAPGISRTRWGNSEGRFVITAGPLPGAVQAGFVSSDPPSKPHPLTERVTREESENDGDCAVGAERPRGYYHRSDGKVVDQDGEVVGSWSWVPPGSPDALTPEEEIAYAVESARIHHQQGGLDGLETRRFISGLFAGWVPHPERWRDSSRRSVVAAGSLSG